MFLQAAGGVSNCGLQLKVLDAGETEAWVGSQAELLCPRSGVDGIQSCNCLRIRGGEQGPGEGLNWA
jgi:hypothetical protein